MSSAAFYYKLNKKLMDQQPVGSIVPMIDNVSSNIFKPSGDVLSVSDYPLLSIFSNNLLQSVETTNFSLTGQVPFTSIACSPDLIVCIGQNSKIYTSTNAESWTSYDCPAPSGQFTGFAYFEYIPAPINKFCIVTRVGSYDYVYLSTNGQTWNVYDGGYNVTPGYFYSINVPRWIPPLGKWIRVGYGELSGVVSSYGFSEKSDITSSTGWSSNTYSLGLFLKGTGYPSSNTYMPNVTSYENAPSDRTFNYDYIYCKNGMMQTKIFGVRGYYTGGSYWAPPDIVLYANDFVFPYAYITIVYDVANGRYFAIDSYNKTYYKSGDGFTWTGPTTIGVGTYIINDVSIRTNQSRFVVVGDTIKTTDTIGTTWTTQSFLTLGGNFQKVATDNISGKTIACALASSTVAYATNGSNFDLTSVTTSADWSHVYFYPSATIFILTSSLCLLRTSLDGITWTAQSNISDIYPINMCHIGVNLCAITGTVNTLTSVNGTAWTKRASTVPLALRSIVGATLLDGTNRMVAVGTNICYTSDDYGVTAFSSRTIGAGDWSNIVYNENKFVCISLTSLLLAHSDDGVTWTTVVTPFQPKSLVYAEGYFIIKGIDYLVITKDLTNFGILQPCESTSSGAKSVYDSINKKIITANLTSISYADIDLLKIRLPKVESTDTGITNYIKVA